MNNDLWEKAKELALHHYEIRVEEDTLSDGSQVFFVANPELVGCKSQGTTLEEAISNLTEARVDYIYSLLEDGLSLPPTYSRITVTGSIANTVTVYTRDFNVESSGSIETPQKIQLNGKIPLHQVSIALP